MQQSAEETMLGRWAGYWNRGTALMGDPESYFVAAEWLRGLDVEDWGCGLGAFQTYCTGRYTGIDGTESPAVDVIADLTAYRSTSPGILLRHVLEHNHAWRKVLDNALASFTGRLAVVLYTPLCPQTWVRLEDAGGLGVPEICFRLDDLRDQIIAGGARLVEAQTLRSGETVLMADWGA